MKKSATKLYKKLKVGTCPLCNCRGAEQTSEHTYSNPANCWIIFEKRSGLCHWRENYTGLSRGISVLNPRHSPLNGKNEEV